MFNKIEDARTEFKEILNDKLEKEIVGFLNTNGGNLYIGINNNSEAIGIKDNIDEIQLKIKDRLKNNILQLIKENNRITQKEIINNLNVSRTTVTRTISYLKEYGYINRIGSDREGYLQLLK